jgi:hypothetical protein
MIMQGGQGMLSFRKVAVFMALVSFLLGLSAVADAAQSRTPRRASAAESGEPDRLPGRGPGAPEMVLRGPVVSVNPASGFIVLQHGTGKNAEEIPVEVDNKTNITRAGRRLSIDEIKVGDRVKISYTGQAAAVSKTVDVTSGPAMRSRRRG